MGAIRQCAVGALIVLASAMLVACTDSPAEPTSVAEAPSTTPEPEVEAEPEPDPELVPEGTAEDNRPYFDFVNSAFLRDGNSGGRPIIDNLVAAGFEKAAMEVTADRTPRRSAVDSVQFAVRVGDECLIGQTDDEGYVSIVAPALESGACLIGKTRAIDW